jgi:ornithine racemase
LRTPAIKINCDKITHNANHLRDFYLNKGIETVVVLKGVSGDEVIAQVLIDEGYKILADTNIQNLKRYKEMSNHVQCMMMRTPAMTEIEDVLKYADISLNTEVEIIHALSQKAIDLNRMHDIILMIELGDLREGILPENLINFIVKIKELRNIKIVGIGTNFACFNNSNPNDIAMKQLSDLADLVEKTFDMKLRWISGGNSSNYNWVLNSENIYRINQVRIGESILCGMNPIDNKIIPGLYQDAFTLLAEVIESKYKGIQNNKNKYKQIILNIGKQDTYVTGLKSIQNYKIVNFSSNHLAITSNDLNIKLGSFIEFNMDYIAMMRSMTSPNVYKYYLRNDVKEL